MIAEWLRRLGYLLHREREERLLQQEMEAHRAMMGVGDRTRFGHPLQLRERSRDVWGWGWLDALARDLRFALRGLRRTPVFTLVATVSLAVGLALTATTVSVVNAYLVRTLPYPEANRLYHVMYAPPGPWEPAGMTALDWTSVADVVEYPIASTGDAFYVTERDTTVSLRGQRVTRGFAEGLGVSVVTGRPFAAADFAPGAEPVVLIGHALWRDRFGSDPGISGRLLRAEAETRPGAPETFRIVGVLPPGFYFGRDSRLGIELLIPNPAPIRVYMVRLRAGVPPAAAERRLTEAARQAATAPLPDTWTGVRLEAVHTRWIGNLRPVLLGVTGAVILVLIIVCANVAVLMLLRALQRQKEVAVRLALGSGWGHIARMLLTETLLICAVALGAGLAITQAVLATLAPQIETQLGRPSPSATGIAIDTTVIVVVGGVSLLVAIALSLAPLRSLGRGLTHALQHDARTSSEGPSMRRLRSSLIAFEVAGSLVLLVGCGLMIRSVVGMMDTELGFNADGLLRSRIMLRTRKDPDPAAYRRVHERFAERLSAVAGTPVAFSSWPAFVAPPVSVVEPDGGTPVRAGTVNVSAGYFGTFGIPLRAGRDFTPQEATTEAAVAVISETLATHLWPTGSALGRRLRAIEQTTNGPTAGPWRTVVGVAGDVRQTYDDSDRNDLYAPRTPDGRYGSFYLRTGHSGSEVAHDFERVAAEIDREAVINPPRRVADDNLALAGTRFLTLMLTGFAAMAGGLAMLGIYGVTAYAVQQRHKEIAIRVALGASEGTVVGMFLREGGMLLGAGTLAGIAGGALVSRVLRNQVFGVQGFDAATSLAACVLLLAAGFAAVFWAARGAAGRDPVRALNG